MRAVLKPLVGAVGLAVAVAATPAAADTLIPFTAVLNAAQENPPVPSSAQGLALVTFNRTNDMLCYMVSYQGLTSAELVAHFHGPAAPGQNAPVLFSVSPTPSAVGSPKRNCVGPLTRKQERQLRDGLFYLNVHSTNFPDGEIRGQVLLERGRYRAPAIPASPSGAFVTDVPE